jgi:signal transduction histidine kinase
MEEAQRLCFDYEEPYGWVLNPQCVERVALALDAARAEPALVALDAARAEVRHEIRTLCSARRADHAMAAQILDGRAKAARVAMAIEAENIANAIRAENKKAGPEGPA